MRYTAVTRSQEAKLSLGQPTTNGSYSYALCLSILSRN